MSQPGTISHQEKYGAEHHHHPFNCCSCWQVPQGRAATSRQNTAWKCNIFIQYVEKESVDISILVSAENGHDLSYCKIKDADRMTTLDVHRSVSEYTQRLKKNPEKIKTSLKFMNYLPTFVSRIVLEMWNFIVNNLGISIKSIGYDKFPYGSIIITNVGSFGYDNMLAPIPPCSGVPIILTIGSIVKKPKVIDNEIMIREVIAISVTIDHRYTDASRAIRVFKKFQAYINYPEKYLDNRSSVWEMSTPWKV